MKSTTAAIPTSDRPLANSYWVLPGRLLAGEHPSGASRSDSLARLERLHRAGIDAYVDLTEEGELPDYRHLLPRVLRRIEYLSCPIADMGVPYNASQTQELLAAIRAFLSRERRVYVHCRAGIGRTGLVIGCFLAEEAKDGNKALKQLNRLWQQSARAESWPQVPQTNEQADYIRRWLKLCESRVKSGK